MTSAREESIAAILYLFISAMMGDDTRRKPPATAGAKFQRRNLSRRFANRIYDHSNQPSHRRRLLFGRFRHSFEAAAAVNWQLILYSSAIRRHPHEALL